MISSPYKCSAGEKTWVFDGVWGWWGSAWLLIMEAEAEKSKSPGQLWRAVKKNLSNGNSKKLKSVSHDTKQWFKHPDGPKPGRGGFPPENTSKSRDLDPLTPHFLMCLGPYG